ncbi:MAG: alpha/beta hydrolase [Chlorobiaceae bacterium]|nr:alpha/beta hydrolase [Chlorobiaceae bacterium]
MAAQTRFITLGGHRHRFLDTGGDGPVMLLLHGISASFDFYDPVIPMLGKSFRVLGLDLLGFGKSDKPRKIDYSLQLYAGLIREFLEKSEALDRGPVYGTGHSMGGKYLLATALIHPETFSRMVLSNTDGFVSLPQFARAISLPGVRHLLKPLVTGEKMARSMFDIALHNRQAIDDALYRRLLDIARDPEAFETVMNLNRNMPGLDMQRTGLRSRLHELKQPILVIWGDRDRYLSPKFARVACRELAASELIVFSNCGHCPMLEYPEQFSEAIKAFIFEKTPAHQKPCL